MKKRNYKMKFDQNKQKGLGMVEIMIGLAIFVTFIATILTLGRGLLGQTDVTTASMDHTSLVNGVRNMYRLDNNYGGLTNTTLLSHGQAVPESMRGADPTSDIRHEWSVAGDEVVIVPIGAGNQQFTITYSDIPPEYCVGFASSIYRDTLSTTVDGTLVTNSSEASVPCAAATAADTDVTMVFTYE